MDVIERLANQTLIAQSGADANALAEIGKVALRSCTRLFDGERWKATDGDSLRTSSLAASKDTERFHAAIGHAQLQSKDFCVVIRCTLSACRQRQILEGRFVETDAKR